MLDPDDCLLLSLLNHDMHSAMCTFPSVTINASKLSLSNSALEEGEVVAKGWKEVLRFLSRRRQFAIKLRVIGTLPVHMVAGIIDNNGSAGGGALQRLTMNEAVCEGIKMYVPRAMAFEDERLLEQSKTLSEKYAFLTDMETFDMENTPTVLSASRDDFQALKKDATTHFAACSSIGACAQNFGKVIATCDIAEHELSLIGHTFSYFMTVEDLKANLDVIPLSMERLKREAVRWSMLSASMGDSTRSDGKHPAAKFPCYRNIQYEVDMMILDFNYLNKLLQNGDDALEALSYLCNANAEGPVNRGGDPSTPTIGNALRFWKSHGENLESITDLASEMKRWSRMD